MNREIKFRVWTSKTMDYFPETHSESLNGNFQPGGHGTGEEPIFMQYTGLKDKNGKEIYEGDVLYKFGIDDAPYEVKYGVQPISHEWLGIGFYTEHLGEMGYIFGGEEIEVIGNIYENPELLN